MPSSLAGFKGEVRAEGGPWADGIPEGAQYHCRDLCHRR